MKHRTATTLGVSFLAALTTAAMAQPGGDGSGRPGGGGGRQGGPPDPAQFIDRMMENDANGDGKLSADELPGRFAERMFESGDANSDGFLDRAELQTAFDSFAQRRQEGQRPGQTGEQGRQGRPGGGADRGAQGSGGGVGGDAVAFNFESGMSQAGRAISRLRRSEFDDASRSSDLRLIQTIQSGLISAKSQAGNIHMSTKAEERYGSDEVTYRSDFRLMMIQTIMETLALEAAVIEGDSAGAKESLAHLLTARNDSHDAFQSDEDDHDDGDEETAIPEPNRVRPGTTDRAPGRRGVPDSDA